MIVIRKHDHAASISCHVEGSATPESETSLDHGCAGRFNVARLDRLEMLVGYELHVTRAEECYASEDDPIDLPEWLAYAASNPGLAEAGSVDWAGIGRVPVFAYTLPTKHEVSLTWFEGRIDIKGVPDDRAALGLVHIAVDLKASLIGDDGERYIADGVVPSG